MTKESKTYEDYAKSFHECPTCKKRHATPAATSAFESHCSICQHCKNLCREDYTLRDDVWQLTGLGKHDGVLHLECIEQLIKRRLHISDFTK